MRHGLARFLFAGCHYLLGTAQQFKSFFIVILPMVEGAGIDAAFHCLGILVLRGKGIVGLQE